MQEQVNMSMGESIQLRIGEILERRRMRVLLKKGFSIKTLEKNNAQANSDILFLVSYIQFLQEKLLGEKTVVKEEATPLPVE